MAATKAKTRKTAKKPPSRKTQDKEQYERFREFARQHEADDDPEAFDRTFRKIVPAIEGLKSRKTTGHDQ
jgi:hypothetical protein